MLSEKMSALKRSLMEYASLVEGMIDQSIRGFMERDQNILGKIIKEDEPRANAYDRTIDEMCTAMVAQFDPLAKDLRTALMILKMNRDLERMGDHAVNISESGLFLIARPFLKSSRDIQEMGKLASTMLKNSINAFVSEDAALARSVCERDQAVDNLGDKILNELIGFMRGEQDGIKRSLHLMRIAYNLERVADLSTNICEEVIYIVEGRDVKHQEKYDG